MPRFTVYYEDTITYRIDDVEAESEEAAIAKVNKDMDEGNDVHPWEHYNTGPDKFRAEEDEP